MSESNMKRKLAVGLVIIMLLGILPSCSLSQSKREVGNGDSSKEMSLSISQSNLSEQYFQAVDMISGVDQADTAHRILGAALSANEEFLFVSSDECISVERYDQEGLFISSFSQETPYVYDNGGRGFYEEGRLFFAGFFGPMMDVYEVNLEKEEMSNIIHVDLSKDVEQQGFFLRVIGFRHSVVYAMVLNDFGQVMIGYSIETGEEVFRTKSGISGNKFFWIQDQLYAYNTERMPKQLWQVDADGQGSQIQNEQDNVKWEEFCFENGRQLVRDTDGIWFFDERGVLTNLVSFANSEVNSTMLLSNACFAVSNQLDRVVLFDIEGRASLLFPGEGDAKDKQTLTLACVDASGSEWLNWAIYKFNKENEDYRIVLKDYYCSIDETKYLDEDGDVDYSAVYDASEELLWKDVVSGQGPDLILRENGIGDKIGSAYLDNCGFIQDLYPQWCEESEEWKQQFMSPLFTQVQQQGRLMSVPIGMMLMSVELNSRCALSECGTYKDTYNYLESASDIRFLTWTTKEAYLKKMLAMDMDSFVNRDLNQANFDSEAFQYLLCLCNEYCMSNEEAEMIYDESIMLFRESVDGEGGNNYLTYTYRPITNTEKRKSETGVVSGYPMGHECDACVDYSYLISISSACRNNVAAWDFIKYMLSEEVQRYTPDWLGCPYSPMVRRDVLSEMMDCYEHPEDHMDYWDAGGEWDSDVLGLNSYSEDEIQSFLDFFDSTHHFYYYDIEIIDIVLEESAHYFSGNKDMDSVVQTINNRVQVVLDERDS